MKIAFILPSLAKKGPIIVVKDIVDNLVTNPIVQNIVIFYFDDKVEVDFPCQTKKINFKEKINFDSFDIIHSHMLRPDLYLFKNKLFGNIKKSKLITTLHQYNDINLQYDLQNKVIAFLASRIWILALIPFGKVVVLSKHMKDYYEKEFLFNKKIQYIYNGRPIQNFKYKKSLDLENFPKNSIVIGTSARLSSIKGLEQIIKIMPKIYNLYFIIFGDGEEKQNLITIANDLNVLDKCIFMGFINDPHLYYQYIDLFVLPSRREGFPLSLLEAASMKKAIVTSDLDICKEAFSNEEISTFKLDDLDDLKNKILETYQNKTTFENNVYKAFSEKYTSNIMANNYLNMYKELVSE
jgi:glycosyltransferase involved in cell wall biosynthesis